MPVKNCKRPMVYDLADRRELASKLYKKNCKRPVVSNTSYALTAEGVLLSLALVVAAIKLFRAS